MAEQVVMHLRNRQPPIVSHPGAGAVLDTEASSEESLLR